MVDPSPRSQSIHRAAAVAVTDKPGTDAVAVVGPQVVAPCSVHSHSGIPTVPISAPSSGVRIVGPSSAIRSTALSASCAGSPPYPAGGPGSHVQPPFEPGAPSGSAQETS